MSETFRTGPFWKHQVVVSLGCGAGLTTGLRVVCSARISGQESLNPATLVPQLVSVDKWPISWSNKGAA